jgi:NDP-sugar pyrophosphorylase family protein
MTINDELLVITPFDQSIDSDDLSILERVDKILGEAVKQKNAFIALNACRSLVQVAKTSGLGLAKILYMTYFHWDEFNIEDKFEDIVYEYVGLHKYTVSRYVRVWAMHQEKKIPAKFEQQILQRNINDQIPIATALVQGYKIQDDQWDRLANAADFQEISHIVRQDIKGKEPSVDALRLHIDRMGIIWAYRGAEKRIVGNLEVQEEDEIIKQAIQRIINNCGITEES